MPQFSLNCFTSIALFSFFHTAQVVPLLPLIIELPVAAAAVVVVVVVVSVVHQQQHVETECILNQSVVVLEEGFGAKLRLGTSDGREKIGLKV